MCKNHGTVLIPKGKTCFFFGAIHLTDEKQVPWPKSRYRLHIRDFRELINLFFSLSFCEHCPPTFHSSILLAYVHKATPTISLKSGLKMSFSYKSTSTSCLSLFVVTNTFVHKWATLAFNLTRVIKRKSLTWVGLKISCS